jgi:hypothetical protein
MTAPRISGGRVLKLERHGSLALLSGGPDGSMKVRTAGSVSRTAGFLAT